MATHSNILAWRIPGTEEPSGLPSKGLHTVGHDWSDLAAAAASWVFPQLYLIYYWAHKRHSSLLLHCFLYLTFLFGSVLWFPSLYWHSSTMLTYFLFYHTEPLIIPIFNSQSDNSNIPAMSGSDVYSVSSGFIFLPLGMRHNFFLTWYTG